MLEKYAAMYYILFNINVTYSITLLSCNSDAQASDNVNSDIKVINFRKILAILFYNSIINSIKNSIIYTRYTFLMTFFEICIKKHFIKNGNFH